jgi:hypothetical protein
MAKIYNPGQTSLHPRYMVYHNDTSISNLYVKIFPNELLYKQSKEDSTRFSAGIKIEYKNTWIEGKTEDYAEADTGSMTYMFSKDKIHERFYGMVPFRAKLGNSYNLKVVVTDINRNSSITNYIRVEKQDKLGPQNYMVLDHHKNYPLSPPYIVSTNLFRLKYAYQNPDSIFISYYNFKPGAPKISSAYNEALPEPDSIWLVPYSEKSPFVLFEEGLYFFPN